jgi:hypothetical protein
MPRTQRSLDGNISKLTTTTKVRKTRSDKKPEFINTKSDTKFTCGKTFSWYLHPVKKDHFNKSWFIDYDDACKQIARLRLQPKDYTLWHNTSK